MRNTFFLSLIFSSFILQSGFCQSGFELSGTVVDCDDQTPLILGEVVLKQNGAVVQTAEVDANGGFEFSGLKSGKYLLTANYFYLQPAVKEINVSANQDITICLSEENADALQSSYKLKSKYVLYHFGTPMNTDDELNKIAVKYGVQYKYVGVTTETRFTRYNEIVKQLLIQRNGDDWEKKFWEEVEQTYTD